MFDREDPAGWISCAYVYFHVQGTTPTVKVDLAQLCMEGPTIHFSTRYSMTMKISHGIV